MNIKAVVFSVFTLCAGASAASAQMLKVKCNTYENLQICLVGKDAGGHHATSTIYDVTAGESFSVSIYKAVLGYEYYKKEEMIHEKYDSTWVWDKMYIYNNNVVYDSIDISGNSTKRFLAKAGVYATVHQKYDREYMITEVKLTDN